MFIHEPILLIRVIEINKKVYLYSVPQNRIDNYLDHYLRIIYTTTVHKYTLFHKEHNQEYVTFNV